MRARPIRANYLIARLRYQQVVATFSPNGTRGLTAEVPRAVQGSVPIGSRGDLQRSRSRFNTRHVAYRSCPSCPATDVFAASFGGR